MTEHSRWPLGKQSAAIITIDYHDIHGILTQAPAVAGRDKTLSVWRYGTLRGVDRLLDLLAEKQLLASWCLPALVAEEQPQVLQRIVAAGHEIACSADAGAADCQRDARLRAAGAADRPADCRVSHAGRPVETGPCCGAGNARHPLVLQLAR